MTESDLLATLHLIGEMLPIAWGGLLVGLTAKFTTMALQHTTIEKGPPGWYVAWLLTSTVLLTVTLSNGGIEAAQKLIHEDGQLMPLLIVAGITPWLGYKVGNKFIEAKYGRAERESDISDLPPDK